MEVKPGPVYAEIAMGVPGSVPGVHLGLGGSVFTSLWNPQG